MIKYRDGYRYKLLETATFVLPSEFAEYTASNDFIQLSDCQLTIQFAYCWDGASGPTLDTKSSMQGALKHDALYQLIRENKLPQHLKAAADRLLYTSCIEDGMWKTRAKLWYLAVKRFGRSALIRNKDIKVAP